jgi:PAS domain S-box-containing protein
MKILQHELPSLDRFAAPYFFLSVDGSDRLTYLSVSVKYVLGYESQELLGQKYKKLFVPDHPLNKDVLDARQARIDPGSVQREVLAVMDSKGNERYVCIQTYEECDVNGRILRKHACVQNVTPQYTQYRRLRDRFEALQSKTRQLNDREKRVLELVVAGNINKQIARELSVSLRTVEFDRQRILEKLVVDTLTEATTIEIELRVLGNAIRAVEACSHVRLDR